MKKQVEFSFHVLEKTRNNAIKLIESLSLEAANAQFPGLNNTAAWNFCHALVSTQLLTRGVAGLDTGLTPDELSKFRKGSDGKVRVSQDELNQFIAFASTSLEELKAMQEKNAFDDYLPYETSYGAELRNIEEALHFVGVHEALHLGYMMAIRRASEGAK